MEKLPFDLLKINADDVDALEATYKALKENFKVGLIKDDAIRLKEFDMFTSHPEATIGGTLLINHPEDGCHLTFVKLRTVIQGGREPAISYYKYQVWASATLRSDFGRVMIRRETLVDKILNVVHPVELHFDNDSSFSHRFFVAANDKEKAVSAISSDFRDAIGGIQMDDFIIEIANSTLVIGNVQPITPQQTLYMAEFATKLSNLK